MQHAVVRLAAAPEGRRLAGETSNAPEEWATSVE
jgi:hypothetical protein